MFSLMEYLGISWWAEGWNVKRLESNKSHAGNSKSQMGKRGSTCTDYMCYRRRGGSNTNHAEKKGRDFWNHLFGV